MRPIVATTTAFILLANGNALALTQGEAEKITRDYVASLEPAEVSYEATKTVVGDLDGDGKPEIVLQMALLGPTYWSYQLEIFTSVMIFWPVTA